MVFGYVDRELGGPPEGAALMEGMEIAEAEHRPSFPFANQERVLALYRKAPLFESLQGEGILLQSVDGLLNVMVVDR